MNFPLLAYAGTPTNGTDEVQSIAITGAPAGGSFTLTHEGQTTAPIAYNASSNAVQNALQALSNVEAGDVICSGGALPNTAVSVRFTRNLGSRDVATLSASGSFTGGTAPAVAVSVTTPGVRGTYRGAQYGALLADTTNGIIYQNDGSEFLTQWAEFEV